MLDEGLKALLTQGILGVVALIALWVAAYLYRELRDERARNAVAMKDLMERYLLKGENWVSKYSELSSAVMAALEALQAKTTRRSKNE